MQKKQSCRGKSIRQTFCNRSTEEIEDINPIEPAVIENTPNERFQFERESYFCANPIDYTDENPVFSKVICLKDSWDKKTAQNRRKQQEKKYR